MGRWLWNRIISYSKKSGEVRKMPRQNKQADSGISTDYIYAIYSEGDYIWFGGIEGHFTRYNSVPMFIPIIRLIV